MNKIRKISVGNDLKDAIHYFIGSKGAKGLVKDIIYDGELWFTVYIIEGDVIQLWKSINKNMVIAVEFDID